MATLYLHDLGVNDLVPFLEEEVHNRISHHLSTLLSVPILEALRFLTRILSVHDVRNAASGFQEGFEIPPKVIPVASGVLDLKPKVVGPLQLVLCLGAQVQSCRDVPLEH